MSQIKAFFSNPKVQKYGLLAASYAAGAYGGPMASSAVQSHGPAIIKAISYLFGG
jgi:hypothetical protein